ncbi:MAG: uncharacterized protein JWL82_39 [Parcubacteria group bacterium]|nr:uncharacterized protein [Parcubacteria group bacterium]
MTEGFILRENAPSNITLRKATPSDLAFLYRVSTEAMRPVTEAGTATQNDAGEEYEKYKAKFDPEKIDIIQYNGKDVGRLRVVRSEASIYVGGIQILPEYQGKGIGTSLFTDLIQESITSNLPITLEVHDINTGARAFYENLGFEYGEKKNDQTIMIYNPVG